MKENSNLEEIKNTPRNGLVHHEDDIILDDNTIDNSIALIDGWLTERIDSSNNFTNLSFPSFLESEKLNKEAKRKQEERLKECYKKKRNKREIKKIKKQERVKKALFKKEKSYLKKQRYIDLAIEIINNADCIERVSSSGMPTLIRLFSN